MTLWTVARQVPLSMGFSRPGYWRGLPSPPPGDLPDAGIEPPSPVTSATPALASEFFTTSATWEAKISAETPCNLPLMPGESSHSCLSLSRLSAAQSLPPLTLRSVRGRGRVLSRGAGGGSWKRVPAPCCPCDHAPSR